MIINNILCFLYDLKQHLYFILKFCVIDRQFLILLISNIYIYLPTPNICTMTFRSLQMSQYQMIIPRDSAYSTINLLGYQDTIHLTDSADPSNRVFSQMVKRCDECLQKLGLIDAAVSKQNIAAQQQIHDFDLLVPRLRNKWKQQAHGLGQEESKLIDTYEERVSEQYQRFQDLTRRIQKMADNHQQNLQKIACLQILTQSFGDFRPKRQNQEYYIKNISEIDQIQSVSFLIGVVDYQLQWKINRIIYRVSRGYACTKTLTQFKFSGLKNFNKKVILVIYPSSQNLTLEKRILRVMQTFCTNVFLEHQLEYSAKQMYERAISEYNQITNLYQMGKKQYKQFLKSINKSNQIQIWRTFFWKEKKLYQVMNMLDRRQQFFIGNIYIPKKEIKRISLLLNKVVPTPTLHSIPLEFPPTAFDTNSYTTIAQEITDTYGVPRYNQINPSIFATITFPFFFGIMFGDVLHGIMVFALGVYAVMNSNSLQKGSLSILARFKYMITLMGFFSIYCGFIYNDFAGFNMNFFSSCFTPPPHPAQDEEFRQLRPVHSAPDCVYVFGIDPIWGRAQNQLVFVNSLKMKISVIIAIIHMTFGVICKGINTNYFKKKLDFYFQFIPQLIFLVLLFGYMDFLIIFKWLKPWDQRVGDIAPQQWAPSIIATMMNIMLSFGKTTTAPDGNSNMWGQRGNSSQDLIQFFILIICVICIPLMLFPKPYIETRKLKKNISNIKKNPLANQQQDFFEQSKIALQQKLYSNKSLQVQPSKIEQHQSSQIFVHQLIETIQFVLGTISNTASYLRLWALSLAHSQLSKVFFQQTAGRFFGDKLYFQIPSLFIGSWMVMWITFGIILCMDSMECFLHALRLHWVEFQNKFYKGDGYRYNPLSFKQQIIRNKKDV